MNIVLPGSQTSIETTSSLSFNEIPLTPLDVLPMERASSSLKRAARPFLVTSINSCEPFVNLAPMSSSPSSKTIPFIPPCLGLEYSSRFVFFTVPCFVAKTK